MNFSKKEKQELEKIFNSLDNIQNLKKRYDIKNTQCFLTEIPKNFTSSKGVKIKIEYLHPEYKIIFSSPSWKNVLNEEKIFFRFKNWSKEKLKSVPNFICHGNNGLYFPEDIYLSLEECLKTILNNEIPISELLEKNLKKYKTEISKKNFSIQ